MKKILFMLPTVLMLGACKKETANLAVLSSFTLVNATTDVTNAKGYAADHLISWKTLPGTDAAAQYNSVKLGAYSGNNYVLAVSGADTTIKLYDNSTKSQDNFAAAAFNTLFLCGSVGAYEAVFLPNDNIPNYTDSSIGIRFINLSPNGGALNITLSGTPTVNEATGINYKQKTEFKKYPALISTAAMTFQIRDSGGVLLGSFMLPVVGTGTYPTAGIANGRFMNITLVIKGLKGTTTGTNVLGLFPVTHF